MKEEKTYIGSAEIRFDDTDRRDKLVAAAKGTGFLVDCSEAMDVSFSGLETHPYWYIVVDAPGILSPTEKRAARVMLAAAWKGL